MKPFCLLLLLGLPANAWGQAAATSPPAFTTTGAFFALSVADVKASADWYAEKFGMQRVMDVPRNNKVAVVVLEGGGLIVELIQHDDAVPLSRVSSTVNDPLMVHGFFKAGLMVEDFDRALATLKARGVSIAYGPFPARSDQKANVIIRDNAGNLIQLFGKSAGRRADGH